MPFKNEIVLIVSMLIATGWIVTIKKQTVKYHGIHNYNKKY